mgnify:FL=1
MFPLGDMLKSAVRELAKDLHLHIYDKKDSTGICFIGERKFSDFLKNYININHGDIVDTEGNILGTHEGVNFYTIGQRQGLGIGGLASASDAPWYVVAKHPAQNKLVIAQGNNHPALFNQRLSLDKIHWINPQHTVIDTPMQAKIRYRQTPQLCQLQYLNERHVLHFEEPQRAVTPGQYAVFYQGEHCLGGGIINQRL